MNFLDQYVGEPIEAPSTGLVIISFYSNESECGGYHIWDLGTKLLIKKQKFHSIRSSSNLMDLAGITDAVCYLLAEGMEQNIFSTNSCSVSWAKNTKGKQSKKDDKAAKMFSQCISFLKTAEYGAFIKNWSPEWGNPRQLFE